MECEGEGEVGNKHVKSGKGLRGVFLAVSFEDGFLEGLRDYVMRGRRGYRNRR